jgi:hypothetical protein
MLDEGCIGKICNFYRNEAARQFCHHCQFEKEAALLQRNMKMAGKVDK